MNDVIQWLNELDDLRALYRTLADCDDRLMRSADRRAFNAVCADISRREDLMETKLRELVAALMEAMN